MTTKQARVDIQIWISLIKQDINRFENEFNNSAVSIDRTESFMRDVKSHINALSKGLTEYKITNPDKLII